MLASPVQQQRRVTARFDLPGDGCQVLGHGVGVAPRHDQRRPLALLGADGAEDVGRYRALVLRRRGPGAALGPAPGQLVLLADAGLVAEPDLEPGGVDGFLARNRVQAGTEAVLKSSTAPSACAWWRGRAESLR